ncbi:hypothetical protein COCCADRAFT_88505, partial [Bipolaris zeicola 26-R-13]
VCKSWRNGRIAMPRAAFSYIKTYIHQGCVLLMKSSVWIKVHASLLNRTSIARAILSPLSLMCLCKSTIVLVLCNYYRCEI